MMLPRSTYENLSRRYTRLSCECSRGGTMYHNMMALRSELGISECLIDRCALRTWFSRPST